MDIININSKKYFNNKIILFILAAVVLFSWFFTRWLYLNKGITSDVVIFNIPFNKIQFYTIIAYSILTIILILIKVSPIYLVFFSVFTIASTYPPIYLNYFNRNYYLTYYFVYGLSMLNLLIMTIKKGFRFDFKLILIMVLILGYSLFSIVWANNLIYGSNFFAVMMQGYLAYYLIRNSDEKVSYYNISWFLSLLLLIIGVQLIAFLNTKIFADVTAKEFFQTNSLFDYIKIVVKGFGRRNKSHFHGIWTNPNIVAGVIGLSFFPSFYKYFSKEKTKYVFLYLPFELLAIHSVFAILSNGLLFGFGFSMLVLIPTLIFKNYKVSFYSFITVISAFLIFVVTVVLLKDKYLEFFERIDDFSTSRFSIYETAVNLIKKPLVFFFGAGIGSSKNVLSNFYYHSWIFNTFANLGIIGFSLTILMIYQIFKILIRRNSLFSMFLFAGAIVYLSHGIFDVGFDYQFLGVIYYGIIAIIERDQENYLSLKEAV